MPPAAAPQTSMLDFNEQRPTKVDCEQLLDRTWPVRAPTDSGPTRRLCIRCVVAACTGQTRLWDLNDPPKKERERINLADTLRKHCERHHPLLHAQSATLPPQARPPPHAVAAAASSVRMTITAPLATQMAESPGPGTAAAKEGRNLPPAWFTAAAEQDRKLPPAAAAGGGAAASAAAMPSGAASMPAAAAPLSSMLAFYEQDNPSTLQPTAPTSGLVALQRASSVAESAERRFPSLRIPRWFRSAESLETIVFQDCGHPSAEEWLLYLNRQWPPGDPPPTNSPVCHMIYCDLGGCRTLVCDLLGMEVPASRQWRLQKDSMGGDNRMWLARSLAHHCAQYHPATRLEDLPIQHRR